MLAREVPHKTGLPVHVESPARLIRFDPEDLERLGRRYPRIASLVYRNLNEIQAARMQRSTQALGGAS